MSTKKPELNEILEMCQTAEKLIKAVFTGREQKNTTVISGAATPGVFFGKSANQYNKRRVLAGSAPVGFSAFYKHFSLLECL
jgi:hypothetical protein